MMFTKIIYNNDSDFNGILMIMDLIMMIKIMMAITVGLKFVFEESWCSSRDASVECSYYLYLLDFTFDSPSRLYMVASVGSDNTNGRRKLWQMRDQ